MIITGNHHVTAICQDAEKNYQFFTNVLGMRLVKKTVNQDDIHTYHLFYADKVGTPGTDVTFFDFKGIQKGFHGTDEISRIGLRVPSDEAIDYFKTRLESFKIATELKTEFSQKTLFFNDEDGQQYRLVSDQGLFKSNSVPYEKSPVPKEFQITGLGPMTLTVSNPSKMDDILKTILGYQKINEEESQSLYEISPGGNGARVIMEEKQGPKSLQGYGTVHHTAFKIKDLDILNQWTQKFNELRAPNSGFVDRFYFKSLYVRLYGPILFELATEGPGFADDEESIETLGQTLALPPKLRPFREEIEKAIKPIHTP